MTKGELKEEVYRAIDSRREEIIAMGEDIRVHPELGYKEIRTAGIVAGFFGNLGLPFESGLALTGVKSVLSGRCEGGPTVAYLGELDSVLVHGHPDADPATGAAHACGHNAQIASLCALAFGLAESGVISSLDGNVALMAVPAEEYVEIEYRRRLKADGKIEFLGGKPELIRLGAFDDIDMTFMTHQASREEGGRISVSGPSNGCVVKQVRFRGKASHAGGAPHDGVNALKAATIALLAIDANRETFKDEDHIRVHPIITKGGELVNVVPDDVRLETYVRGASVEAIKRAAAVVDRCLRAGAAALGAEVTISTLPGYLPRIVHSPFFDLYKANAVRIAGEDGWWDAGFGAGSTDMGDVSHIMPAIEAVTNGARGTGHGADYRIADPDTAYILPAKAAAAVIIDLLAEGAGTAKNIIETSEPAMGRDEYLSFMKAMETETTWTPCFPG